MNNLTAKILNIYGLEIVGRYVGLSVNKVLTEIHPDDRHIPAHKLSVLTKLISAGDEHASIMRQVSAHLLIRAPRYWWVQWDKYRYGVEMYSSSTMHTLLKSIIDETGFTPETSPDAQLALLKALDNGIVGAKANLPEGYLQTRLCLVSYQALRHIWLQRRGHKLPEWAEFIRATRDLPYATELIFIEPRNPWRKLWDWVLADEHLPWVEQPRGVITYCAFCGYPKPRHESTCPYAKARSMIIKEITDVITE